jgi:hypothetical protein
LHKTGAVDLTESDVDNLVSDLAAKASIAYVNTQVAGKQTSSASLNTLGAITLGVWVSAFLGSIDVPSARGALGLNDAATHAASDFATPASVTASVAAAINTALGASTLGGATVNSGQIAAQFDDETGTSFTFSAADNGKLVTLTNAAAITGILPNNLAKGWNCLVYQGGAGQVTFSPASGATLHNRQSQTKTAGQYAVASLLVVSDTGTNAVYVLGGDTA